MSVYDTSATLGKENQNLILETAGRIWIKVQDRFYELDFRNQNKGKSVVNVVNNITETAEEPDLSGFVTKKFLKSALTEYVTKRTWSGIKETTEMLENALLEGFTESISPITINTMQLVVGSEQLQYDFITDFTHPDVESNPIEFVNAFNLKLNESYIKHYTLDGPTSVRPKPDNLDVANTVEVESQYCRWHIPEKSFTLGEGAYYVYLKVPNLGATNNYEAGYPILYRGDEASLQNYYRFSSTGSDAEAYSHSATDAIYLKTNSDNINALSDIDGEYVISQTAIELNATEQVDGDDVEFYYLLFAILNNENEDGTREYSTMNGFTEITPGRVTAYRFMSPDGYQYLNFLDKTFHLGDAALEGEIPTDGPITNTNSYIHWDERNGLIVKGNLKVKGGDLQDVLNMMQSQIDDEIQAWFSSDPNNNNAPTYDTHCEPTTDTWPANTWNHTDLETLELIYDYDDHLGDLYYITDDLQNYDPDDPQSITYKGQCYRFIKTTTIQNNQEVPEYQWIRIADNSLAEVLGKTYENEQTIAGYDYLKEALREGTTNINGGLVLSSLIQLGNWNRVPGAVESIDVHAGMNGQLQDMYNNQYTYHDIAAWYGGPMEDKFEFRWNSQHTAGEWVLKSTQPLSSAKSVFRHDGSGYLANGEIYWQSDGSLKVPGITLNSNGDITLDSGVIVSGTGGQTLSEFNSFFEKVTVNGVDTVKLKNAYAGLWAEGFGSFGGLNSSGGSGGIDLSVVWNSLTSDSDAYASRVINRVHIPSATTNAYGGIKTGYQTNGKNYKVQLDSNGNAYVNVPWDGGGSGSVTSITILGNNGIEVDNSTAITGTGTRTLSLTSAIRDEINKISGLESDVTTLSGNVTTLLGRTNWDDYFDTDINDNVYVKPIDTNTTRGFYNEGYICAGGVSINQTDFIQRMWQSLDKTYADSVASTIHSSFIPPATSSTIGGIKIGSGLSINNGVVSVDGTISGNLDPATTTSLGVVQIGTGINVNNGVISLRPATTTDLGGVIVGNGLSVSSGTISVADPVTNYLEIVNNNTTLHAISDRNFYTNGYICAGGIAADEPNFIARMWNSLKGSITDSNSGLISNSFIPPATSSLLGGVKVANNSGLTLGNDGSLSVTNPNGSGGTVTAVKFDSSVTYALNTNYEPASNSSVISLPAYPTVDDSWKEFIEVDDNGDVHILPKTVNGVETPRGFYNEGWGSFGGINSSSSGTVDLDRVWQSLTNELSDTHASDKIHRNHIPIATNNAVGGIIASNVLNSAVTLTSANGSTADRYYGVQVDNTGKAFVNVPWQESTQYTLPVASSSDLGGIKIGYTDITEGSRNYAITLDQNNKAYVNVPWTDTVYTHPTQSAISISDANGQVLSGISVDTQGHTSAVSYKTLTFADMPSLYVAQTPITGTAANANLLGISGISYTTTANTSETSYMYWDTDYNAWHLKGNLIADGYGSFGGVNSSTSGFASLLSVWRSLTNNNTLIESDINQTIKIAASHIFPFTITGTNNQSYDLDNLRTYTAGDGINISNSGEISAHVKTNGGLSADSNGLYLTNTYISNITTEAGTDINSVGTPQVTATTSNGVTTLTFNYLKGAAGTNGTNGTNGTDGTSAYWFTGTAVSGTGSNISKTVAGSKAGDMYLNTSAYNVYKATATNTWNYVCNIKGASGISCTHSWSGTTLSITSGSGTSSANLKGEAGANATISIGTVSTGAAGSSATVTNTGTSSAAVFNFTIPKGDKGDPGQNATTTNIFSTTANGLAPAFSSTNKSTAESSQSNYYLCGDGKYRQLPTTAFSDNDRYVNTAAFENDNNNSANPVKMTLTRAGSDSSTVTANIPKVSSSSAGVVPKGTSVSTQNQNTKFLREDGSWAKPSYTNYTPGTGIEINNNEIAINSTEVLTPGSSLNAADLTGTIPSGCYTNTTYTFATGDSNGQIKVTPSGGSAQNISVAGLSDLAYISKGSGTTTYLRNDGSWATPPNDNSATLQVGDINNRKINTSETTGSYIKFTGDTNKFTVTDGTKSFDVSITPSISSNVIYSGNLTNGNVPKYSGMSGTIVDSGCKLEQSVLLSSKLTDTTYNLSINKSTNGDSSGTNLGTIWCATTSSTNDTYSILQSNGESAPTWTNSPNLRGGLTVGYADTRTNQTSYTVEGNVTTKLYGTLTLYKNKALRSGTKYNFSAEDFVTLQTMPYQYYPGNGTSNSTNGYSGTYLSINSSVVLSSGGKYYDASDIRLKKNIKEITNTLTAIEDLPIVQYEYKSEEGRKYIGTLAQKLLPLYPELVIKGGDGYYSVDYGGLAAIAIQGLKELNKRVKYLEDKLYGNNER